MFSDQHYTEGKVFLRSYADAQHCLRDAAEKEAQLVYQTTLAQRIIDAKTEHNITINKGKVEPGRTFSESREVKLFQFSNFIFQKYLGGIETYQGSYKGFQDILAQSVQRLKKDIEGA